MPSESSPTLPGFGKMTPSFLALLWSKACWKKQITVLDSFVNNWLSLQQFQCPTFISSDFAWKTQRLFEPTKQQLAVLLVDTKQKNHLFIVLDSLRITFCYTSVTSYLPKMPEGTIYKYLRTSIRENTASVKSKRSTPKAPWMCAKDHAV